MLLELCY